MLFLVENNLLSNKEKNFLLDCVANYNPTSTPGEGRNYYFRDFILENKSSKPLLNFLSNIKRIVQTKYSYEIELTDQIWINRVGNNSNKNDNFHTDKSRISSVTFLNSNFNGGNFSYVSEKGIQQISPSPFSTIVFEGSVIKHKVLPVTEGYRYTLVTFWDILLKSNTSLI